MLSHWPIRSKLHVGAGVLIFIVILLATSGFISAWSYRSLVRVISNRAAELPLAYGLIANVNALAFTLAEAERSQTYAAYLQNMTEARVHMPREDFRDISLKMRQDLDRYREQLYNFEPASSGIGDNRREREIVTRIQASLDRLDQMHNPDDWIIYNRLNVVGMREEIEHMYNLADGLPVELESKMLYLKTMARNKYHALIGTTCTTAVLIVILLVVLVQFFNNGVFRPLQMLVDGSRRVAKGDFNYRIQLDTHDEVAELAGAMNDMTRQFQEIRDDLDAQVQLRTREAVRSEQLASVGYLAAGVAHEINNPLAAIAWCAESLESRMHDIIQQDDDLPDGQHNAEISILRDYLRKIQDEAFRCKGITDGLLDLSRTGAAERETCDLGKLVQDVIELTTHVGRYRNKQVDITAAGSVIAQVNPQQFKQVVLNIVTNALESVGKEGRVHVSLKATPTHAELHVTDNGYGMTDEVLQHLFEPFYTNRRDGHGTGLGLSIAFRIVEDHGGTIQAGSDGPGQGSRFLITLPLVQSNEDEKTRQSKAA